MPGDDHQSAINVNLKTHQFEISGSEEFVDRMLDRVRALIPEETANQNTDDDEDGAEQGGEGGRPRKAPTLDDFVEIYKLEGQSGKTRILAFVYFLIKVQRSQNCSSDEIRTCFEDSGVEEPDHLLTVVSNLKKEGLINSAGSGRYKITSKGARLIKALASK